MKFFHLSDLHIGLKLFNRSLLEDQKYILHQIVEKAAAESPDAVVIAGDIYDTSVPSSEAMETLDNFIKELTDALPGAVIMLISGNHDSAPRINMFRNILARQNVHMIGNPPSNPKDHIEKITLSDEFGKVNFYLLPFVKPSMIRNVVADTDKDGNLLSYNESLHRLIARENIDCSERNVLVSHQFYLAAGTSADQVERMESEMMRTVGNIDEVKADILEQFDYAALGHIHKPMKVGKEVYRYSGTPIACSVSEAGQEKSIVVVELSQKGKVDVKFDRLEPLRQVRKVCGELAEVLKQGSDDYTTVILTDKEDLDVIDMQDRLRNAYPNLLEIRRETSRQANYSETYSEEAMLEPFELLCSFLGDLDDAEKDLLKDVVNSAVKVTL